MAIACTVGSALLISAACERSADSNVKDQTSAGEMGAGETADVKSGGQADASPAPAVVEDDAPAPLAPYVETIPVCLVEVEMLPVPAGEGVDAFYLSKTELTWDAYAIWALCEDIDRDAELSPARRNAEKITLRTKELRPSAPYDDIFRGYGRQGQPALGMSRLSAELYCEWLSEMTGRTYRLPTKEEWLHAFRLNHGDPDASIDATTRDAISWHEGNSRFEPQPVGSARAGGLGHHDLLGNLSEWVTGTGEARLVLGGHFLIPGDEIRGGHQIVKDESWNMSYPNEPKSIWWFVDAEWVGFRIVCEPGAQAALPAEAGTRARPGG